MLAVFLFQIIIFIFIFLYIYLFIDLHSISFLYASILCVVISVLLIGYLTISICQSFSLYYFPSLCSIIATDA